MRTLTVPVLAAAALGLAAGPAGAATLAGEAGVVTYAASPGHDNAVQFLQTGPKQVQAFSRGRISRTGEQAADTDPIVASGTCAAHPGAPGVFSCDDIAQVVADTGDGDDEISSQLAPTPARLFGSTGNDRIIGGPSKETLDGGEGDDLLVSANVMSIPVFFPAAGDLVVGGPGLDRAEVVLTHDPPPAIAVSLNDAADDGPAGYGLDVRSDVEDVFARSDARDDAADAPVTLVGSPGPNLLTGDGPMTITGGDGADTLRGAAFDDAIESRDGFADQVTCAGGTDAAAADAIDTVAADCEQVSYATRIVPEAVSLSVRRARRSRFRVSGVVARPANVPAARACADGVVAITVRAGRRRAGTAKAALRPDCAYRRTLTVRRAGRRALRFSARYAGSAVMRPKASRTVRRAARR